ncbi:MAG: glycolate oxidase subunit GlcD [Ignavibacteriales bacterium CG07_land_8_20_14_0_80_59_12]|nr:MAG: glycolate oxidase subunit GlcD [Ignavibacteriales bacterium CG07_land_8_20_14_0_80_59_12]
MIAPNVLKKIREIVASDHYHDSLEHRIAYSYDGTPLISQLPDAVVLPRSVEDVSALLKFANEERFGVVPRGSGSGLSGGSIPGENTIVLVFTGWNRILEIDRANMTMWVEPGVITSQVHKAAEESGLFYPPDPGSMNICTLGGNVAENAGGLRGLKYGVTKNYVMGMEVVLPTGDVPFSGGKSMKDVAGYSLKDWLIGSEGTLGVFTRILLKLVPPPQEARTLAAYYNSVGDAAETVSAIIAAHVVPATLEFLDNTTIRCVEEYANLGLPVTAGAMLLIEVDGRKEEVAEDSIQVREIAESHKAKQVLVSKTVLEADRLKAARRSAFAALARLRPTTILEDVTVPRSEVAVMVESIRRSAAKHGLTIGTFGHAGDGNLHPTCLIDERDTDEVSRAENAFEEIFREAIRLGGTITGEHGVGLAKKKFLPLQVGNAGIEMMRKIKESLDPNDVLNPGKIISTKPRCEGILPRTRDQIQRFEGAYI